MKMRKGFTLVELLIVIVIIGILAGAMMLTTGGATDSAKASKILSDLRNIKGAIAMIMLDSPDLSSGDVTRATIAKYMDRPAADLAKAGLGESAANILDIGNTTGYEGKWFLKLNPTELGTAGVVAKLAKMAEKGGILSSSAGATYTSGGTVMMIVR